MSIRDAAPWLLTGFVVWFLWEWAGSLRNGMTFYLTYLRGEHRHEYAELKRKGLPLSAWRHLATFAERGLRDSSLPRLACGLRADAVAVPLGAALMLAMIWAKLGGD